MQLNWKFFTGGQWRVIEEPNRPGIPVDPGQLQEICVESFHDQSFALPGQAYL
ncbi:MAG TPA: hypothetical protein VN886_05115 [Acidimicrobiales bacterium]|nr:hypothetical protein [Acidimicrobiales bacterium]